MIKFKVLAYGTSATFAKNPAAIGIASDISTNIMKGVRIQSHQEICRNRQLYNLIHSIVNKFYCKYLN